MAYGYLTPGYPYNQTIYPQVQPQTAPSSLIWVGSFAEAQLYPVAPNNAVALWDSSTPAIYVKQADASGRPTIKAYDLVERVDVAPQPSASTQAYVTKNELTAALEALKSELKGEPK